MTYDNELTLTQQTFAPDAIGNQIPVETQTTVLCGVKSVGRSEFYNAALAGHHPEMVFVIHAYEYGGQPRVSFGGTRYKVIRTYATGTEEIELTCERVSAGG